MVWLAGSSDSYGRAEETLARIGRVYVSDSSIWRQVQAWGERFIVATEAQVAASQQALSPGEKRQRVAPAREAKGVAMDGTIIHIRKEGWKELKVGCVFDIEARPTKDEKTGQWQEKAHAVNNRYVSHLGGPDPFGHKVWAQARAHGWFNARNTLVLGDGAVWIWNQAKHHFVGSRQLVDWYHAAEHLHHAALCLHPEDATQRLHWYEAGKSVLYEGQAAALADTLFNEATHLPPTRAEALETEAGYFSNNSERMGYASLREAGFPIGSGMVESGCKQFKARFDGPGMRWSRPGAERLLPIRATVLGGCFDETWQRITHSPPN